MEIDVGNLEFIDSKLRTILTNLEIDMGFEFTITSLYRIGDNGVHGTLPLRGCDLRCRDKLIGQLVCDMINDDWDYDPSRDGMSCAIYHDIGQGAHIHVQVHPKTVRKT